MTMASHPTLPAPEAAAPPRSLESRLRGTAGYIAKLPRGERAELRRLAGDGVPPEIFWRIVARFEIPPIEEEERFWLAILPLMARHRHASGSRAGAVLARRLNGGARIERWLRLDRESARREAHRLLSLLDAPIDWVDLGLLLHDWTEVRKSKFARDFYLAPEQRRTAPETEGDDA